MTTPIPLTISQLTTANICPVSPVLSVGTPNVKSDSSAFGDAVHEVLETSDDPGLIAMRHAVSREAVEDHVANVAVNPDALTEQKVELVVPGCGPFVDRDGNVTEGITGTADAIERLENSPLMRGHAGEIITDYKTGSPPHHDGDRPIERWAQGMGYGLAWLEADPFLESVTIRRLWTKTGLVEEFVIDQTNYGTIKAWIFNLVERICEAFKAEEQRRQYRVSMTWDGCLGCDGLYRCPAFEAQTRRALALAGEFNMRHVVDSDDSALKAWEVVEQAAAFARGAKELKSTPLAAYLTREGAVEISETTELRMVDHHTGSKFPAVRKKETEG